MITTVNTLISSVSNLLPAPANLVYPIYDACTVGSKVFALTTKGYTTYNVSSSISISSSGTSPSGHVTCALDSASALIVTNYYNTLSGGIVAGAVSVFNLNTNQLTTVSASSTQYPTYNIFQSGFVSLPNQAACVGGIALVTNASSSTLTKYTVSSGALSLLSLPSLSNTQVSCIIPLTSTFLIGNRAGQIAEINSSGAVLNKYYIGEEVRSLAYSDGYITATSSTNRLYTIYNGIVSESIPMYFPFISQSASGVVGTSFGELIVNQNPNSLVPQVDYNSSTSLTDNSLYGFLVGGFVTGNKFWAFSINNYSNPYDFTSYTYQCRMGLYNIVPSDKVNSLSALVDTTYKKGRKIFIIDDGNTRVETDVSLSNSPVNIPVSSGKSIIDIAIYNNGMEEKGSVSFYNT